MSTSIGPEAAPKPSAKSIYEQRKRYSTVVMADVSQYPVNHLVTFCLGEEDGVHTVEDATRKLAVMDSQGRVWAQEMLLRVSPDHVTLLDHVSKEGLLALRAKPPSEAEYTDMPEWGAQSQASEGGAWVGGVSERPWLEGFARSDEGRGSGVSPAPCSVRQDILNHVFDDVESFVSKLQKSAEAARVLEHRERGPTPALQARLRGNIANPSSPELLHFLFGPLHVIVEMWRGPGQVGIRRTKQQSWRSKRGVWARAGQRVSAGTACWELPAPHRGRRGPEDPPSPLHSSHRHPTAQSSGAGCLLSPTFPLLLSHQDPESEPEPEPEPEPAGKWVLCNYDFQARNSSELSVKHRDVLEVLDDQRKWWKVRDQRGQEGYVPYNILTPHPGPQGSRSPSPARVLVSQGGPLGLEGRGSGNQILGPGDEGWVESRAPGGGGAGGGGVGTLSPSGGPGSPNRFGSVLDKRLARHDVIGGAWEAGVLIGRQADRAPLPLLRTVDALGVLTGAQIFSLQKEEFRAVSPEEGARVYSQVTVQRALLEDKENVSELEAVMEKQKKKVEGEMETKVI
ncbi:PREDICTED: epidermal growth factor receptor kinase substrate 8-like protein 1 [Myotis davidii]|uniref:epidermal growth factor receptor kinase substrate 8-like protein 1 n=1 Tax=Myotis davidii TaxID=225400 RepID=UPI000767AE7B|nr:PREDICTED: epidermal growth factor receptor kinase substrate 8-like protein 1 [Myotis davidii]